jgi:hypothetical protein
MRYFAFFRYWIKEWEYSGTVHQLLIDIKGDCDLIRMKVLNNILYEFDTAEKLVKLNKTRLRET